MSNFKATKKPDNSVKIDKTAQGIKQENKELLEQMNYKTTEEIITAIKKIADKVGIKVEFTYDKRKKD